MTNKIIEAARLAGFEVHPGKQQARVGWDALTGNDSTPKLAHFYAIAYRQGLEDAAKACRPFGKTGAVVAAAIRALKHQDAAIAAGKGEG